MATSTMARDGLATTPSRNLGRPSRRPRFSWTPLLLLALSVLTTASSGARFMHNFRLGLQPLASENDLLPLVWIWRHPASLGTGAAFALTLLSILLAHEAGHFFYCWKHGIRASWPYVLPAPTFSGTAGAVIRIKSRIPSRRALMEVGIAGPIAGFAVAVPAAILGIVLSQPARLHSAPGLLRMHQPLTITALHHALASIVPGLVPTGRLIPHPILLASWIGFFITSLNLIPAGQLDGGHILYAISPKWHRLMTFVVPILLLGMGLFWWTGWLLWAAILLLPAMRHPHVPMYPALPARHRWLGCVALALLILTLLPDPFVGTGLLTLFR